MELAVPGTVAPVVTGGVDDAVDEDDCGGATWLAMSCCIHSCCSGVKPCSAADDRAIVSRYFPVSTSKETMERDTAKSALKHVVAAASIAIGCECACA